MKNLPSPAFRRVRKPSPEGKIRRFSASRAECLLKNEECADGQKGTAAPSETSVKQQALHTVCFFIVMGAATFAHHLTTDMGYFPKSAMELI